MPSPPAAVCRSSPVCAIRDRIYCVENQAVRADEAPSAWLGRGSGEDTGQALMSPHTAGKQPKPFLTEITALLAERSHKIFSPDQLQLLSKTAAKMSSELKADLESTDSAGQCWERGECWRSWLGFVSAPNSTSPIWAKELSASSPTKDIQCWKLKEIKYLAVALRHLGMKVYGYKAVIHPFIIMGFFL